MALMKNNLKSNFQALLPDAERIFSKFTGFIRGNPIVPTALISATTTAGAIKIGTTISKAVKSKRKKSTKTKRRTTKRTKKRRKTTKRGRARDRKYISRQKHERRYLRRNPKRRKTGKYYKTKKRRKGVHYTKNGQPYIIKANGRAKFIKRKRR